MIRACGQTDSTADFRTRMQLAGFRKQTAHTAIPGDGRVPRPPEFGPQRQTGDVVFEIGDTLLRVLASPLWTKREAAVTVTGHLRSKVSLGQSCHS